MRRYLLDDLMEYSRSDVYPFHMPGHKRDMEFPNPFSIDITEISGFDDLHHPDGILRASMEWAAGIYGADRTFYLVNGSSSGILSAICAATTPGGRILISRNCHKSVYHGVFLNNLKITYSYPQIIEPFGLFGGLLPEDMEELLKNNRNIQAVLIVSPTYDGVVSDIRGIAKVVHRFGIPLIVDEAHGAHFPFGQGPVSALECGADVVIQSVHKTLPSLTQTAVMHVKSSLIEIGKLERYLQIYQSSSPSYVFLSSIENSIRFMTEEGHERLAVLQDNLRQFRKSADGLRYITLPGEELIGRAGVFDYDHTKLWMILSSCARVYPDGEKRRMTGELLAEILRREYQIELESCGVNDALAICSCMDSPEGLKRLEKALLEIDRQLEPLEQVSAVRRPGKAVAESVMTIAEAWQRPEEAVEWRNCRDRVSAAFIYVYPPGIPIVVPGERITEPVINIINGYRESGLAVHGITETVACVADETVI